MKETAKPGGQLVLEPLDAKNRVELIIERIVHWVLDGTLQPGSSLPSERDFANGLGVSRAIIREALSALQIVGLVERRSGSGSFISPITNVEVLKNRALSVIKSSLDPYVIWEARASLEPAIAELVAEFATEDDLTVIHKALSLMDDASGKGEWGSFFEADYSFHMAVAAASHNAGIIQVLEPLFSQMQTPLWQTLKKNYFLSSISDVASLNDSHKNIYVAVKDRNVKAFKEGMDEHFCTLRTSLEDAQGS